MTLTPFCSLRVTSVCSSRQFWKADRKQAVPLQVLQLLHGLRDQPDIPRAATHGRAPLPVLRLQEVVCPQGPPETSQGDAPLLQRPGHNEGRQRDFPRQAWHAQAVYCTAPPNGSPLRKSTRHIHNSKVVAVELQKTLALLSTCFRCTSVRRGYCIHEAAGVSIHIYCYLEKSSHFLFFFLKLNFESSKSRSVVPFDFVHGA